MLYSSTFKSDPQEEKALLLKIILFEFCGKKAYYNDNEAKNYYASIYSRLKCSSEVLIW